MLILLRGRGGVGDLEWVRAKFGGAHLDGKPARQLAGGGFQSFENVGFEALAEGRLEDGAAVGIGGNQCDREMRERKDAAAARERLYQAREQAIG